MKNSLGSTLAYIIMLALSLLHGEDFTFLRQVDTPNPYVKEGVLLSIDLNQTNPDIVLLFNFDLKPSSDYVFRRIDSKESDSYHNAKVHYLYLLYPLKAGDIDVDFRLTKRVTNDESVAYSFSGDRDNVKGLVTKDSNISLPPLRLHVKPLPKGTTLVGDFTLTYALQKKEAEAYEPISFRVTLKGRGYPPLLASLFPKKVPFTLFTEKPIVQKSHSKRGTFSTVVYPMALSSDRDFTTPPITIHAFDPKKERAYTLKVPPETIRIEPADLNALVDKIDTPPPLHTDWQWLGSVLGYLLAFISGFATAWFLKWHKRAALPPKHPLEAKIDSVQDKKALLQLLLAQPAPRFSTVIEKLERDLYGKGQYTLTSLKKEAKEQLQ